MKTVVVWRIRPPYHLKPGQYEARFVEAYFDDDGVWTITLDFHGECEP